MKLSVLAAVLLFGCAGQAKTNTTYDSSAESGEEASQRGGAAEHKMPESPKMKADDME
jgi:hypothetical protein